MRYSNLLLSLTLTYSFAAAENVITTVAGSTPSFPRYPISGVQAPLGEIPGLAIDSANNLYASDFKNDIVVKVAPDGSLTVLAGNGIPGFSGDGGPATNASLNLPGSVASDAQGNVYIADILNSRIRRVRPDGTIDTYAGTGKGIPSSGDGGPATKANFNPDAIAIDLVGSLYIMDNFSQTVRRIDGQGIITTFAGGGTNSITEGAPASSVAIGPGIMTGITTDPAGNALSRNL